LPAQHKKLSDVLRELQKDLYDLSANNPFVQVKPGQLWFSDEPLQGEVAEKIYRKAAFFENEYGLKTTLLVHAFLRWKIPGSAGLVTSPLICQVARVNVKKRIETTWSLEAEEENYFINPILQQAFSMHFEMDLPSVIDEPQKFIERLVNEFRASASSLSVTQTFNTADEWQIIEKKAVGIFNYRKSLLHEDYSRIIARPGQLIGSLFGESRSAQPEHTGITPFRATLDESQEIAAHLALSESAVIQGPPGTGKSHTVATLIKSYLIQHKTVLFVSEKRSALEVVYDRLKKEKLAHLVAWFNTEKNEKKTFYSHLAKSWKKAADVTERPALASSQRAFEPDDLFSIYPGKLAGINAGSGVRIHDLEQTLLESGYMLSDLGFKGTVPAYGTWSEYAELLYHIEKTITSAFRVTLLQDTAFSSLNGSFFNDPAPLQKLDKTVADIQRSITAVNEVQHHYDFKYDLEQFTRLAIAGSIMGMVNKNQLALVKSDHKQFKAFNTLAKKYELTRSKLNQAEQVTKKWKKKPTIAEITDLIGQIKQSQARTGRQGKKPRTILGILKRNSSREIDYFIGFSRDLSASTKLQLLEELRTEWHLRGELESLKIRLKHELNISDPDNEINHILQVRSKLDLLSPNEYITILEHERSLELIRHLREIHPTINRLNSQLNYLSRSPDSKTTDAVLAQIHAIQNELPLLSRYQHEVMLYFNLPPEIITFLARAKLPVHQLDAMVTYRQLLDEIRFIPGYVQLNGDQLLRDFANRTKKTRLENSNRTQEISEHSAQHIKQVEKLLSTPAAKLSPTDKEKKQTLKNEKRILLHELNKTRQYLPVKQLVENCPTIVPALQPVWMMNPLSVAQHLPCTEGFFDVVIFDESSQVPLEDAIPAVYRGTRLIVVGDEQQMPPPRFFTSKTETPTLLDQASVNLPAAMLKWHYRSEHPSLIEFSNRHFYDHELLTFPPLQNQTAIELKTVPGLFDEQKNTIEAQAVAAHYAQQLKSGITDIGIIAFSKEQQREIENQVGRLKLPANDQLVIRNLENVQGIEKEVILVSVGYGPGKNGVFRKHFGPVNLDKGANRLNVLFTRAIKKMIVFTSVSSADFTYSDNRGVTLLGDFLRYAETAGMVVKSGNPRHISHRLIERILTKNKLKFTFYPAGNGIVLNCFVQHESGKILLVDPGLQPNESTDIISLLTVLHSRFEKIKIITSAELLMNIAAVESQLVRFFME
jgi:hypothetical protein